MSYCVNCGVELEDAAKKCPLCSTPVINPNIHNVDEAVTSYSDKAAEIPESMKKRFIAFIITMVMLIPNIVCFLVNILFDRGYEWIWHLNATSTLIWIFFVLPLMLKKKASFIHVLLDAGASIGYSYVIFRLEKGSGWFLECVVPIVIIAAALMCFIIEWIKRNKPKWPFVCIAVCAEVIIASLTFDMFISHYVKGSFLPSVSLIISASAFAVMIFFIAVACNKKLQSWLTRKFFVE